MNRQGMMKIIQRMAKRNGFYDKLYDMLNELKDLDKKRYNDLMQSWENMDFQSERDFIKFLYNSK